MKRCYIGLGGIGCRLLKKYEEKQENQDRFVYMDAVPEDLEWLGSSEKYSLTKQKYGCTQRLIGKDEIKTVIYNDSMPKLVDPFFLCKELELIFVTTTFGGFGSAVVFDLSDYYGVKIRNFRQQNGIQGSFSCKVIAFPLQSIGFLSSVAQGYMGDLWATNEIQCVNEFRDKEARNSQWYKARSNSMPCVDFYVPCSKDFDDLYQVIGMSDECLREIDIKRSFYMVSAPKHTSSDVFISYSSENQGIADLLVSSLKEKGITSWISSSSIGGGSYARQIVQGIKGAHVFVVIVSQNSIISPHVKNELNIATNQIKEGLVIMPFKIDNSMLDDDFEYYLGRHEAFMGKEPPITERIMQFTEAIQKVLNNFQN